MKITMESTEMCYMSWHNICRNKHSVFLKERVFLINLKPTTISGKKKLLIVRKRRSKIQKEHWILVILSIHTAMRNIKAIQTGSSIILSSMIAVTSRSMSMMMKMMSHIADVYRAVSVYFALCRICG